MTVSNLWERFQDHRLGPPSDEELATLYIAMENAERAVLSLGMSCYEIVTLHLRSRLYAISLVENARNEHTYWASLHDSIRKGM